MHIKTVFSGCCLKKKKLKRQVYQFLTIINILFTATTMGVSMLIFGSMLSLLLCLDLVHGNGITGKGNHLFYHSVTGLSTSTASAYDTCSREVAD